MLNKQKLNNDGAMNENKKRGFKNFFRRKKKNRVNDESVANKAVIDILTQNLEAMFS